MKRLFFAVWFLLFSVSGVFAASLLSNPKFQAFDSNGDPLSSGNLYTYISGTTTAKSSYSDRDCSTSNANPIVLDSRGEATVYLCGSYKLVLKDSDDVTIWTMDNISGSAIGGNYYFPDASASDQGATGDSNTVKYYVDSVGSDNATIYLQHNSGAATTTYTFSTSETIPSNITLELEPGAVVADDANNATLTIAGHIKGVGLRQIFNWGTGTGSIVFNDPYMNGVYPQWWEGDCGGAATDCTAAIQNAINAAAGSSVGHYKSVYFVPGEYSIESTITLKTAPLIGVGGLLNSGVRILWNGSAGTTAFQKEAADHEGNNSFALIENINFRDDGAKPGYWLDFSTQTTSGSVDVFHRIKECHFKGVTKSHIKLERWLNVHWEHLRFDDFGEYCVDIVTSASPALAMGSFVIDGFTADAITQSALGFFHVDSTLQQISNMGVFEISNGRIEINTDLQATNPGIFVHTMADSGVDPRTISFKLRNVVFQDISTTTVYVLYRDTADTAGGEAITLENFRHEGCDGLLGGTAGSSFNDISLPPSVGYLSLNIGASAPKNVFDSTLLAPYSTHDALQLINKDDTQARMVLNSYGYFEFGPGDAAADTGLRRSSTAGSGIYGFKNYVVGNTQGINVLNKTTELTSLSGATETWTNAIPAGVMVIGLTARVTDGISGVSIDIGDGVDDNLFMDGLSGSVDTVGDLEDSTMTTPVMYLADTNIVLTAVGGSFSDGDIRLTLHYIDLVGPTS